MKFFITGGAGFIGSHLCEKLITQNHQIICMDNFNDYYDPRIKKRNVEQLLKLPNFHLIDDDILNHILLDKLFSEHQIDIIVHLAARAGVRPSIQQPLLYQKVNIEGTVNLLECCKRYKIQKFIMASSSSVYGNNKKVPFSEDDPVDEPISPYAATKKACELIAYTYHHLYALPITCLRFFTVYGPRQRPDMAIYKFTKLINNNEPLPMYGDGTSRRDYTYIADVIDGILKAIDKCERYHIYNLGESKTISLKELIHLIENSLGKKTKIDRLPFQSGDVIVTYADISKAQKELGYKPETKIEEGISLFIDWYLKMNHNESQ